MEWVGVSQKECPWLRHLINKLQRESVQRVMAFRLSLNGDIDPRSVQAIYELGTTDDYASDGIWASSQPDDCNSGCKIVKSKCLLG